MKNILILGSGAREHAIADKFEQSKIVKNIYVIPGNDGIEINTKNTIALTEHQTNHENIYDFVTQNDIDTVFVGSEQFLADGIVDFLTEKGIKAIGPTKAAARIESSKVFAKNLMKKYMIPTAFYETFSDKEKAIKYIQDKKCPIVIKADGLAAGKGVLIAKNHTEAAAFIEEILSGEKFGTAGNQIVIEQYLKGQEASVFAFCDGENFVSTIFAKDHKKACDGDKGLNTGGMGAIAPINKYKKIADIVDKNIIAPTLNAMKKEGTPFTGILFAGLMIDKEKINVIEFNCRLGDPETQVILPLLKNDIYEICEAITHKNIDKITLKWKRKYAVNVVLASIGYPEKFEKGQEIEINPAIYKEKNIKIYFAGIKKDKKTQKISNHAGRVISITAIGNTLSEAKTLVYKKIKMIKSKNLRYRKDIGK